MTELNDFIKDFGDDIRLEYARQCKLYNVAPNDMFTRGKIQRLAVSIVANSYGIKGVKI